MVSITDLQKRIDTNLHTAMREMTSSIEDIRVSRQHPWTAEVKVLTLAHARWVAQMAWQNAFGFVTSLASGASGSTAIQANLAKPAEQLANIASDWSLQLIRIKNELDAGSTPPTVQLLPLTLPPMHSDANAGLWSIFETIDIQLQQDLLRFSEFGAVPAPLNPLIQDIVAKYSAIETPRGRLKERWYADESAHSRNQVIKELLPIAQTEFILGQQLWTPYLMGKPFAEYVRLKNSLEGLELGFDPWILTDPRQKRLHSNDPASKRELYELWKSIADPAAAYQTVRQLHEAMAKGKIRLRTLHGYHKVPWQSQYLVRIPIQIGPRFFKSGELIALYVSENGNGQRSLEIRRTGRLTRIADLFGFRVSN
jgi:hypothetical protein